MWAHDNFSGLISLLNEDELLDLMDMLGNCAKRISSDGTVGMGSFPGIQYTPKHLLGVMIKDIEIEIIKRRNPEFEIKKGKPDWRDTLRNYFRKNKK